MVPGMAASKLAPAGGLTQRVGKAIASQPVAQAVAGTVGGGVSGSTGSDTAGLAAALATPFSGAAFRKLQRMASKVGVPADQQKLAQIATDLGDGDINAGIKILEARLQSGGVDTAVVDAMGLQGQKIARAISSIPGKGAATVDDFVASRTSGRGRRMETAADNLAPNQFFDRLDELHKIKTQTSKPLYDEAFAPVSDKAGKVYAPWDDRLQALLDDPIVLQGMKKGIRVQQLEALADDVPFNFKEYAVKGWDDNGDLIIGGTPNLRAMDAAKRGLDDIINKEKDDFGNVKWTQYLRAVDKVRKALVSKLDDITKDETGRSAYKEARAAYAGPSSLEDAAWQGRKFLRGDVELTEKAILAMSATEKEAFRLGARREISKMIQTDTQAALTKFAAKKHDLWRKLRATFPDDASFASFKGEVSEEIKKIQTERFVSPRAGSQTGGLKEDIEELSRVPKSVLNAAESFSGGRPLQALSSLLKIPVDYLRAPNQKVAGKLATALTETDPRKQAEILKALGGLGIKAPIDQRGRVTGKLSKSLLGSINTANYLGTE